MRKSRICMQVITQNYVRHSQLLNGITYRSSKAALTKADEKCGKCDQKLVHTLKLNAAFTVSIILQLIVN